MIRYYFKLLTICYGLFILVPNSRAQNNDGNYIYSDRLNINATASSFRYSLSVINNSDRLSISDQGLISKLFVYSGVFELVNSTNAELYLYIENNINWGIDLKLVTVDKRVIVQQVLNDYTNSIVLQQKIIEFIDKAVLAIDGHKSQFNSAIIYSERTAPRVKDLVLTDFLGTRRIVLIRNGRINTLPRWSPDGTKLLYTTITKKGTQVYILDFKKFTTRPIFPTYGATSGGYFINDDEIVLTQSIAGRSSLYVFHLKNLTWSKLINSPYITTNGSVFDDKLLFTSNRSLGIQIFLKTNFYEKGPIKRLTFLGADNSEPSWNNNGQIISYTSYKRNISQIFLMTVDGSNNRQLTFDNNGAEQATWSDDGRQLLYATNTKNPQRLIFISVDGQFSRPLTTNIREPSESSPTWTNNFDWELINSKLANN